MTTRSFARFALARALPLLLAFGWGLAQAQVQAQAVADPPARVATLSQIEGSVVFAPAGETDWLDAIPNRPITRGDRLWTDKGARAQVHVGSAALHMDSQTFLEMAALDAEALQASLNEGTINARVRQVQSGENFEIDTPQLAFRATRPGDYRLDVDPAQGTTRVTVRDGAAVVYGANGQAQELVGGQVVTFTGRDLERIAVRATPVEDAFDRWAADLNRAEDQSLTARYVPREVVGYQQLDSNGTWSQDTEYGPVWYPRVTVADWAPYRYGHWDFIAPWGWTWVDDAPWGFAPFHYGRWAMIGSRWAWVPGRIGPRPVYAPALVAFIGSGGSASFSFGSGVGWFPLGPGEVWRPAYRTSPRYISGVNRYIVIDHRHRGDHYLYQNRPGAWTSVRTEDFSRGRPVYRHWQRNGVADVGRVHVMPQPTLPQPYANRYADIRASRLRVTPPPPLGVSAGVVANRPPPVFQNLSPSRQSQEPRWQLGRQEDQQRRMQLHQEQRGARDEERAAREQQRAQREQQMQMQGQRQQDEQRRQQQAQEHAVRQQQMQQERAVRQQQAAQDHAVRQQQQQLNRQQMHEQQMQQRALRQAPPQGGAPEAQQRRGGEGRGEWRGEGRGEGRQGRESRDEGRGQGGDDGGRGNGRGRS